MSSVCSVRIVVVAGLLLRVICDLHAQNTETALHFEQFTTREGLPHNEITSLLMDRAGFLFISTTEGLARFDGTNFTIFKHNSKDPSTILNNAVFSMAIDSKGVIWCGTEIGISAFDPVKGTFTNYKSNLLSSDPRYLSSSPVTKVMVDRNDNVWVGSWANLDLFDTKTRTFTHFLHSNTDSTSIRENRIGGLFQDRKGRIWVGTFTGLDLYEPKTRSFIHHKVSSNFNGPGPLINSIYEDDQGILWLTTWGDGLIRYDPETKRSKIFLPEPGRPISGSTNITTKIVRTSYPGEEQKLWVSTKSSGLYLFDMAAETWTPIEQTQRTSRNFITDDINWVFDDGIDNLFLATAKGLLKYSRSKDIFRTVFLSNVDPGECLTNVYATYQDPADTTGNTIFIGTWTCGAFRYDKTTRHFEKLTELSVSHDPQTPHNAVYEFHRDRRGWLWARTREGVYVAKKQFRDWERPLHKNSDSTAFWESVPTALIENDDGTLWFSCYHGLALYNTASGLVKRIDLRKLGRAQKLSDATDVSFGKSMCEYPKHVLWLTGPKGAILKYNVDKQTLSVLKHDPHDPSSMPFPYDLQQIIVDSRHQLWTTSVNGLMTFDPMDAKPIFKVYHTSDGLPSEDVSNLSEDAEGRIWMATHNGICVFDPSKHMFRTYNESDGLRAGSSLEFSRFGTMFVQGIQLFQYFDPTQTTKNEYCGPIRITSIRVLGKDFTTPKAAPYTDTLSLSYSENEITVSFAMLNYADAKQITYEYFLQGFNDDWIPLGKNHQVTFTNLDGGTYILHIRGFNADGICDASKPILALIVSPPFWRTSWFYGLMALCVVGSVFGYTRVRLHNLHRQKRVLEETVEQRTELLRLEKENVERQKLRAEESERFKEQFLANMSHEIRTPMNAVMGMTNILLDKKPTEDQVYYLDKIRRSSETLLVIINDILDLSKIEAGKMELEQTPFSIRETLQLVVDTLQHKAEEKGLTLSLAVGDNVPDILLGDPTRLQQILINLTGNAIKFTEKGTVELCISSESQDAGSVLLKFIVRDSGIGIAQDKLSTVFESFKQAESHTTRKYGGTGLGLSISRSLVELFGGKMEVKSVLGKGTDFAFIVAFRKSDKAALRLKEQSIEDTLCLEGLRVLLAEDNEYNQIVVTDTLKHHVPSVSVKIAFNGKEAVEKLSAGDFDIVLMDVQMPVMDGLEATRAIRNMAGPKGKIPIVALTASVVKGDIDKCMQAGMNDYVPKPFKRDQLLCTIAKYYNVGSPQAAHTPASAGIEPAPVVPSETVTDLTFLMEFSEGNTEQVKKYVRMFLDATPGHVKTISSALEASDLDTVRRTIHAMKPHFKFMGMLQAAELAEHIEQLCANGGDPSALTKDFSQILDLYRRSSIELQPFS